MSDVTRDPSRGTRFVRLVLTPEQQADVRSSTGRDSQVLELTAEELEARIVPKLAANANESLLVEPLEERVAPKLSANANESLLVEPLEERVAPRLAANHDETLLVEPLEDRIAPRWA